MAAPTLGFFSFTEITDPTQHQAYNEWHQLDHLPEQYTLDGIAHGQRWVLSPDCRDLAFRLDGPFDLIHYVTMYLLGEPAATNLRAFEDLGVAMYNANRFFARRVSHLAQPLRIATQSASSAARVSPSVIPFRPHDGIYVIVEAGEPTHDSSLAKRIQEIAAVAGVWSFHSATELALDDSRWQHRDITITTAWLDPGLETAANTINEVLSAETNNNTIVAAAPFRAITPRNWDWFDTTTAT